MAGSHEDGSPEQRSREAGSHAAGSHLADSHPAGSPQDGSRIEAAEAGVHAEQRELDDHGTTGSHVDAVDALPVDDHAGHPAGSGPATHGPATHGPSTHGVGAHDDEAAASHGGHGTDPNASVLVADPPTPAWVMTAAGIALITAVVCAILGVILHDADEERRRDAPAEGTVPAEAPAQAPAHGLAALTHGQA